MTESKSSARKYLFTVTHFDDDPDRVATPLVLANNALASGGDVLVWLSLEGVQLAKNGAATGLQPKSFPPIADLLATFGESGGRLGVCPPCAKTHGVTADTLLPNAQFMGGAAVIGEAEGSRVFSF